MIGLGTFSSDYVANNAYPALRYMIITESMSYRSLDGMRDTACVGMPFNGLNIPRFFYRVAGPPMDNPLLLAGEIHDHICFMARSLPAGPGRDTERLRGDDLFREMAGVLGANKFERWYLYRSVRIGAKKSAKDPQWPNYIDDYDAFMATYHEFKGLPPYDGGLQ